MRIGWASSVYLILQGLYGDIPMYLLPMSLLERNF